GEKDSDNRGGETRRGRLRTTGAGESASKRTYRGADGRYFNEDKPLDRLTGTDALRRERSGGQTAGQTGASSPAFHRTESKSAFFDARDHNNRGELAVFLLHYACFRFCGDVCHWSARLAEQRRLLKLRALFQDDSPNGLFLEISNTDIRALLSLSNSLMALIDTQPPAPPRAAAESTGAAGVRLSTPKVEEQRESVMFPETIRSDLPVVLLSNPHPPRSIFPFLPRSLSSSAAAGYTSHVYDEPAGRSTDCHRLLNCHQTYPEGEGGRLDRLRSVDKDIQDCRAKGVHVASGLRSVSQARDQLEKKVPMVVCPSAGQGQNLQVLAQRGGASLAGHDDWTGHSPLGGVTGALHPRPSCDIPAQNISALDMAHASTRPHDLQSELERFLWFPESSARNDILVSGGGEPSAAGSNIQGTTGQHSRIPDSSSLLERVAFRIHNALLKKKQAGKRQSLRNRARQVFGSSVRSESDARHTSAQGEAGTSAVCASPVCCSGEKSKYSLSWPCVVDGKSRLRTCRWSSSRSILYPKKKSGASWGDCHLSRGTGEGMKRDLTHSLRRKARRSLKCTRYGQDTAPASSSSEADDADPGPDCQEPVIAAVVARPSRTGKSFHRQGPPAWQTSPQQEKTEGGSPSTLGQPRYRSLRRSAASAPAVRSESRSGVFPRLHDIWETSGQADAASVTPLGTFNGLENRRGSTLTEPYEDLCGQSTSGFMESREAGLPSRRELLRIKRRNRKATRPRSDYHSRKERTAVLREDCQGGAVLSSSFPPVEMGGDGRPGTSDGDSQQWLTRGGSEQADEENTEAQDFLRKEEEAPPQGLVAAEVTVELSCLTLLIFWKREDAVRESRHCRRRQSPPRDADGHAVSSGKEQHDWRYPAGGAEGSSSSVSHSATQTGDDGAQRDSSTVAQGGVPEGEEQGNRWRREDGLVPFSFFCGGMCAPVSTDSSSVETSDLEMCPTARRSGRPCLEDVLLSNPSETTSSNVTHGVAPAPGEALQCCICCGKEAARMASKGERFEKAAYLETGRQLCVGLVCVGVRASVFTGVSHATSSSSGCTYQCSSHTFALLVPHHDQLRRPKAQDSCRVVSRWAGRENCRPAKNDISSLQKEMLLRPDLGVSSRKAATMQQLLPVSADVLSGGDAFEKIGRDDRPSFQAEGVSLHQRKTLGGGDPVGDNWSEKLGNHIKSWSVSGTLDGRQPRIIAHGAATTTPSSDRCRRRRGRRVDRTDCCYPSVQLSEVPSKGDEPDVLVTVKDLISVSTASSWERRRALRECRRQLLSASEIGITSNGKQSCCRQEAVLLLCAIGKETQVDPTLVTWSPRAPALFSPWIALARSVPPGVRLSYRRRPGVQRAVLQRARRSEPDMRILGAGLPFSAGWLPRCMPLPRLAARVSSVFDPPSWNEDPSDGDVPRNGEVEKLADEEREEVETVHFLVAVSRTAMKATLSDAAHQASISIPAAVQACTFTSCLGFCSCNSQVYKRSVFPPPLPPSVLGADNIMPVQGGGVRTLHNNGAVEVRPHCDGTESLALSEHDDEGITRNGMHLAKQLVILDRSSGLRWVANPDEIEAAFDSDSGADDRNSQVLKKGSEVFDDPTRNGGEAQAYSPTLGSPKGRKNGNLCSSSGKDRYRVEKVGCMRSAGQPDIVFGGDICFDSLRQSLKVTIQPYRLVMDWEAAADIAGKA
ncbi:agap005082- related, partial [Cystoisospora suis]